MGKVSTTIVAGACMLVLVGGSIGCTGGVGGPLASITKKSNLNYQGNGMSPTIKSGTRVTMDLAAFKEASPKRGDIVGVQRPQQVLVLRVVGLPGNKIEVREGVVYIDGKRLPEPYAKPGGPDLAPIVLASDEYYLLGDTRGTGNDSIGFGAVKKSAIVGKITP